MASEPQIGTHVGTTNNIPSSPVSEVPGSNPGFYGTHPAPAVEALRTDIVALKEHMNAVIDDLKRLGLVT